MKKIISILLVCFIAISAFGQSATETEITGTDREALAKAVISTHQKLKTLSAMFEQEKKSALFTEKAVQRGNFCYQAPKQLRWEYKTPKAMTLVFNGTDITIKTDKGVETNTNKMLGEMGSMIMSILDGSNLNNNKNFTISYMFDKKTSKYSVVLLPRNKKIKAYYKKIRIVLNGRNYLADQVIMDEASGDITTITFINKKINSELPKNSFTLE